MKNEPPPIRVATPCPKLWEEMSGNGKKRFCEHCQLHVHNLSAMSRRERDHFVAESGGRACIAYELRPDGSMVTPSRWRGMLRPLQRAQLALFAVLATLLPFFFSACASRRAVGEAPRCIKAPPNGVPVLGEAPTRDQAGLRGGSTPPPALPPHGEAVEGPRPMMLGRPLPPGEGQTENH